MAIPDPTTPGDGTDCACHHGGSTLKTPDLKQHSLSGGDKNEILFSKTRSGNLIAFDDHDFTIRISDKKGNAEISLEGDTIQIKHKTGDINFHSEKETRFDCTTFEVHATDDISFAADGNVSQTAGSTFQITSGKSTSFSADKNATFMSYNMIEMKSMADVNVTGKKKTSICTKTGMMKFNTVGKITIGSKQDLGVTAKAMLTMTGMMGCTFVSKDKVQLQAGGPIIGLAAAININ
ncbi:hypothetical protein ACFL59_05145 [Planctomycetota bacterium]